jgi:phosphoribosylformimino-5-aminoimidazole carboxamide ribotide isomerase
MELIAAIDLLGGRARRLFQGDYERPLEVSAEPRELAAVFISTGVRRLHIIDLDGARAGRPMNQEALTEICRQAAGAGVRVQAGGGLRDEATVEAILGVGVDEALLGSAAIRDVAFLAGCAARWPGRIGAALDVRDGQPQLDGWVSGSSSDPYLLAARLLDAGASRLVVTDVARDGTRRGPNLELLADLRRRLPDGVLVGAGGIASTVDLLALAELGLDGAVVGRALLDGSLDLGEALAACQPEVVE